MKRKIGEIYNKPIIEGDINLKGPNEIHKSELGGSNSEGGGGSSSESTNPYYIKNVYNTSGTGNGSEIYVFNILFGILNGIVFGVSKTNGSIFSFDSTISPFVSSQYKYIRAYQIFPIKKEIIDPVTNITIYIDTTSLEAIANMATVNKEYCMYFCDRHGFPYESLITSVNVLLTDDRYITEKEFYDFIKS